MEAFAPFLLLLLFYLFVGLPLSRLNKKAGNKAATGKAAPGQDRKAQENSGSPAASAAPAPSALSNPAQRTLQPSIRITEHDDSVYQGSLYAVTGEGYDPCHDEQMAPLTRAESTVRIPETVPGLQLKWTGEEIVRGFVMSEILKRRGT